MILDDEMRGEYGMPEGRVEIGGKFSPRSGLVMAAGELNACSDCLVSCLRFMCHFRAPYSWPRE